MSANPSPSGKEIYEFGPFRVDGEKEILLRSGQPVSLNPKAFQILLVLLRHSKEVVTKDELMKAVWPDTFVEEANLSRNIFLLRRALGESPQDHLYILTVPGRGYRFTEEVRVASQHDLRVVAATHSKLQVHIEEPKPWPWLALAALVLIALGAAAFKFFSPRAPLLTERDTLVLADFSNSTGDSVFDDTLRQGLAVQLEQSPYLSLVSEARIQRTLGLMRLPAEAHLTPPIAREICERTGGAAVLEGSIASLGSQYVLGLRARSCRNGEILDDDQVQAARKEDVLSALSQMAGRFRRHVGESRVTIAQHNTPLAEATTGSLEALKIYTAAWKVHRSSGASASLPLFLRATQLDPNFAMAQASLGRIYNDLDEFDLSAKALRRAWQLRDRASDPEKFFITENYYGLVTGNLEEARQVCETEVESYPRESLPHFLLSGMINKTPGRYDQAAAEARKGIELEPDVGFGYYNLGVDNAYLNRFAEAENALGLAAARGLDIEELLMLDFDLGFLKGDPARMARVAARARLRPGADDWVSIREAAVQAYSGHLQQARRLSRRAIEEAPHTAQRDRAALWEAGSAVREALFGNAVQAKAEALAALALSKGRDVEYGAAFALLLAGDSSRAQALADDLARRFPDDTTIRYNYLPVLRALLALHANSAAQALEILSAAAPYQFGVTSAGDASFGALYPVYVRGEAFLAQHKGGEAAAEFQKILDHSGIVVSDPVGALARLQLARSLVSAGDLPKAKAAYQDFLTLWKDADPEIPVLKAAQAEFAQVR
jgi:DNA-binding winged helix-turn-helix (wHTH) protein